MDLNGQLKPMDQMNDQSKSESSKKFLVHMICQNVFVNDKPFKILYIQDVTFGVLYEQVKASEQLKNLINTLINNKIGEPLETLIQTSKMIEASQDLLGNSNQSLV